MKPRTLPQRIPSETGLWRTQRSRVMCARPSCGVVGTPVAPITLAVADAHVRALRKPLRCDSCGVEARTLEAAS